MIAKLFHKDFPYPKLVVAAMGALFFLPFLGHVHLFDWDEINFAESAREMLITGNFARVQINYEPFWEKPPLFFWMQALCMSIFGVNEFAARLPNAIFGILTLLTFFHIGRKHFSHNFALLWVLLYLGSFLPHLYFKSGIIDPVFNYFIFMGIYMLSRCMHEPDRQNYFAVLSGIFTGLAVLTKGPVGLLLVILSFVVYLVITKFRFKNSLSSIGLFALMVFLVSSLWFGWETIQNGPWFLVEFIQYQIELFSKPVAGHKQPFYYHFVVVLFGCFPMSVFGIKPMFGKINQDTFKDFPLLQWMGVLFWVVMILFSIVTTKIVHYSSMAYFPLSFLAAVYLYDTFKSNKRVMKGLLIFNLAVGSIFALLLTLTPLLLIRKDWLMPFLKDEFSQASFSIDVPMMGWEWIIGLTYGVVVWHTYFRFRKGQIRRPLTMLSFSCGLVLFTFNLWVVPKIEAYSQGPAISFFKEKASEDVYVRNIAYKSYAQYFYLQQKPYANKNALDNNWLLTGTIDKPAYFITKIHKKEVLENYQGLTFVEQRGGFVIYKRVMEIP